MKIYTLTNKGEVLAIFKHNDNMSYRKFKEICVEAGIKAIGVDMPSSQFSPSIITSALKRVDVGVDSVIKDLVDGKFEGGKVKMFDLSNQGVGYELTDLIQADVVDFVEGKIKSK